jgi:hypothetical protein
VDEIKETTRIVLFTPFFFFFFFIFLVHQLCTFIFLVHQFQFSCGFREDDHQRLWCLKHSIYLVEANLVNFEILMSADKHAVMYPLLQVLQKVTNLQSFQQEHPYCFTVKAFCFCFTYTSAYTILQCHLQIPSQKWPLSFTLFHRITLKFFWSRAIIILIIEITFKHNKKSTYFISFQPLTDVITNKPKFLPG